MVAHWNRLLSEMVESASSLEVFKRRVDLALRNMVCLVDMVVMC